jgi:hypothetical protein
MNVRVNNEYDQSPSDRREWADYQRKNIPSKNQNYGKQSNSQIRRKNDNKKRTEFLEEEYDKKMKQLEYERQ